MGWGSEEHGRCTWSVSALGWSFVVVVPTWAHTCVGGTDPCIWGDQ